MRFGLEETMLDPHRLLESLRRPDCGGYVTFEGAVRNHNDGRRVLRLEYEAFAPLALREGERIIAAACKRFGLQQASCAHRVGALDIGDIAVWVGVGAPHRGEAFEACRYIIDHIKHSVPIWKKEYYEDGDSGWVNCEHCAAAPADHARTISSHAHHHHD